MSSRRNLIGTAALAFVSLVVSLFAAEYVLRAVTPFPITELSHRRADPNFGYVVAADVPDVDANGFRNRGVTLDSADLVVVGDSHTYGYNVDVTHAFPAVLGQLTGRKVYAMAAGGYGIYQYLALIDALLAHRPKDVVLALYPANDLGSACSIVTLPSWLALARKAGVQPPRCRGREISRTSFLQSSALLGAIDYAWLRFTPAHCASPAIRFAAGPCLTLERGERHTRLTSLDDPENRQSFDNALAILRFAHARLRDRGVRFSVLMIPSRERVLLEWSRAYAQEKDPRLDALAQGEIDLAGKFAEFLAGEAIPVRDAAPTVVAAFAAALARNEAFYPSTSDGHPFAAGYAAYAQAAATLAREADAPAAADADARQPNQALPVAPLNE